MRYVRHEGSDWVVLQQRQVMCPSLAREMSYSSKVRFPHNRRYAPEAMPQEFFLVDVFFERLRIVLLGHYPILPLNLEVNSRAHLVSACYYSG